MYRADHRADDVFELWSVPLDGSSIPVVLHDFPQDVLGDVEEFTISPDGAYVAFFADLEEPFDFRVYVAPIDASSAAVDVTGMTFVQTPRLARFTPNSEEVLFLTDGPGALPRELGAVARSGGIPEVVSGALPGPVGVDSFDLFGERVVYSAANTSSNVVALFSLPVDRSEPVVQLSHSLSETEEIRDWSYDAFSQNLVYATSETGVGGSRLYTVPVAGRLAAVELEGAAGTDFAFDGKGNIAYEGEQMHFSAVDGQRSALPFGREASRSDLQFTADGRRVLYLGSEGPTGELWSLVAPVPLSPPGDAGLGGKASGSPGPVHRP